LLQKVRWHRIILDEAHHIRNKDTKSFKGIIQVQSDVKWFLTGTPIQNNIADLHSLLQVLGVDASQYNSPQKLKKTIKKFVLRRTKESIGLPLPAVRKPENIKIPWILPSEGKYAATLHAPLQFSNVSEDEDSDVDDLEKPPISIVLPESMGSRPNSVFEA
jgi:SNF2 family DNA or RNA helicase